MDVQAEDQERPRQLLQFLDDVLVAFARRDILLAPFRKWMRAGGGDAEAHAFGRRRQATPNPVHLGVELVDVLTDLRADLDDGLVELALDLIAQDRGARRQELADMRTQLPGGGIDDLKLLFDADREAVAHLKGLDRAGIIA